MDKVMILTNFFCWITILATTEFRSRTPLFYSTVNVTHPVIQNIIGAMIRKNFGLIEVIVNRHHVQFRGADKSLPRPGKKQAAATKL